MKFDEMTVEELETRQAEIAGMETEGAAAEEIETRADELEAIKAELQAREDAAAEAEETRQKIADGLGETREEHQEEKKMDVMEIRNSAEYIDAYAEFIKTGDARECRAVLLSKNAAASGQVPVPDMVEGIIKTAWEKNEFLNRIRKTYFKGNLRVPFELSATGAWVHAEGSTGLTEEEITIGIVELKPVNIKKWIRISDEALAMGGEEFVRYIYEEVAYRILMKLVDEIITKIENASTTNSDSAIGIPVVKVAPGVMTVMNAAANLSEEATDLCIVMNRLSEQAFNTAYAVANFAIDPWAGLPRVYTSALPAYSTASENDTYAVIGDLKAIQANYPEGEGVVIKWDDLSLAEDDLVKVVGRQYVGYGVTAPGRLVKLTKPGA